MHSRLACFFLVLVISPCAITVAAGDRHRLQVIELTDGIHSLTSRFADIDPAQHWMLLKGRLLLPGDRWLVGNLWLMDRRSQLFPTHQPPELVDLTPCPVQQLEYRQIGLIAIDIQTGAARVVAFSEGPVPCPPDICKMTAFPVGRHAVGVEVWRIRSLKQSCNRHAGDLWVWSLAEDQLVYRGKWPPIRNLASAICMQMCTLSWRKGPRRSLDLQMRTQYMPFKQLTINIDISCVDSNGVARDVGPHWRPFDREQYSRWYAPGPEPISLVYFDSNHPQVGRFEIGCLEPDDKLGHLRWQLTPETLRRTVGSKLHALVPLPGIHAPCRKTPCMVVADAFKGFCILETETGKLHKFWQYPDLVDPMFPPIASPNGRFGVEAFLNADEIYVLRMLDFEQRQIRSTFTASDAFDEEEGPMPEAFAISDSAAIYAVWDNGVWEFSERQNWKARLLFRLGW